MNEKEKFFEWLKMIKNVHQANNERMMRAFEIIDAEWANNLEVVEPIIVKYETIQYKRDC